MKAIRVTYTVRPEFVTTNKENIYTFLEEVKEIADPGMRYTVFLGKDGKTFSHLSIYKNKYSQTQFLSLESFKSFQRQRDESGLEVAPVIEEFEVFGASHLVV